MRLRLVCGSRTGHGDAPVLFLNACGTRIIILLSKATVSVDMLSLQYALNVCILYHFSAGVKHSRACLLTCCLPDIVVLRAFPCSHAHWLSGRQASGTWLVLAPSWEQCLEHEPLLCPRDVSVLQWTAMLRAGHTHHVFCCAFSPNGNMLVSGSFDETIRIWDVANGISMKVGAACSNGLPAWWCSALGWLHICLSSASKGAQCTQCLAQLIL